MPRVRLSAVVVAAVVSFLVGALWGEVWGQSKNCRIVNRIRSFYFGP